MQHVSLCDPHIEATLANHRLHPFLLYPVSYRFLRQQLIGLFELFVELSVVFVVEVTVEVPDLVLRQVEVFLLGVLHAQPVVQVPQTHVLIDQAHDLHVVLTPVTIHKFNLNLYYLSRVLSDLTELKLRNQSLHDQLYNLLPLYHLQQLYTTRDNP